MQRKEDELPRSYDWAFREAVKADRNMVYSSWMHSNRTAAVLNLVGNTIYFREMQKIIDSVLDKGCVYIACSKEDPDQIFGYVVTEHDELLDSLAVHWIYVKHPFRNAGVAQSLMTHVKEIYSPKEAYFTTKTRRSGLNWDLSYNPFLQWKHCY